MEKELRGLEDLRGVYRIYRDLYREREQALDDGNKELAYEKEVAIRSILKCARAECVVDGIKEEMHEARDTELTWRFSKRTGIYAPSK